MSKISSNTLFHFTNRASNLIEILKGGFKPSFCLENLSTDLFYSKSLETREEAMPMTCFCDLRLSLIESHLDFYGSYGIGLYKSWGIKNGLTPITYIHNNSKQLNYLRNLGDIIMRSYENKNLNTEFDGVPISKNPIVQLMELTAFYKEYEGKMLKDGKYYNKTFYHEREWRYVPFTAESMDQTVDYRLSKIEFNNEIKKATSNEIIGNKFMLKFNYNDVKYIIVKTEDEMIEISNALDLHTDSYNKNEIKILQTKIISANQIQEDF